MKPKSQTGALRFGRSIGFGVSTALVLSTALLPGCATVRPEQRAILADPTMQYEASPLEEAARQHVYDNREGTYGGGSVEGGGCGCN
jgi:hypothetical protein